MTHADALPRYIADAARPFAELRDVASHLAGLSILAASGARAATLDHPMLPVAREKWRRAADATRALTPPPAGAHHHRHLLAAVAALDATFAGLTAPRGVSARLSPSLPLLQAAWREVEHAARALPGFHTVDLDQGCCGAHRLRSG